MELFLFEIEFKNESNMLFSQEFAKIVYKTRNSITFTSLIQMEWIKAFHYGKNIIYERNKKLISNFSIFLFLPSIFKFVLSITFADGQWLI